MSEMIERVARAIRDVKSHGDLALTHEDLARAAIAAMREPTGEMVKAIHSAAARAYAERDSLANVGVWHIMIDAALNGG